MWAKIITIKRTKGLNYFSLCAFNLFNTQVSQFELNYWNKWTVPRHSNLLRCTCSCMTLYLQQVFCLCRMSVEDFCRNFSDLDICCSDVNVLAGSHSSSWKSEVLRGQWVLGTTAGGCSNDIGHPTLLYHSITMTSTICLSIRMQIMSK